MYLHTHLEVVITMPIKIIILIMTVCCTACGLVVIRQERINTAHDLAKLHNELLQQQRQVQDIRANLLTELTPQHLRLLITRYEQNTGSTMIPFAREKCILSCDPAPRWVSAASTN